MEEVRETDVLIVAEEPASSLNAADVQNIVAAAKWGKFLAIVQFVCLALGLAFFVFALLSVGRANLSPLGGAMRGMSLGMLIFGLLVILCAFIPAFYLYRASRRALDAVEDGSRGAMSDAIFNLKRLAKFQGILTIVVIAVYIILIIIMAITMR